MSIQTHTIEVPVPDCARLTGDGAWGFIYTVADGLDAAGAVALLEEIRRELDDKAEVGRAYSGGPVQISYRDRREGVDGVRVIVKLPDAQPAEKPEPTDDEALLRKAAADA